jgi:hypothetical protein
MVGAPANPHDHPHGNPHDDPADLAALRRCADELVAAVEVALPAWVQRTVRTRWAQWRGAELAPALADAARDAAAEAVAAVVPPLRALLGLDVDEQQGNPLAVVRRAVPFPTGVLAAAGVPPIERDADAERLFPDDPYDLTPAAFADLGDEVQEPGLRWGAAKAHVVLRRRRGEGRSG